MSCARGYSTALSTVEVFDRPEDVLTPRELLPDLIDAGLDAMNPVQITCRGMEASGLKRDFGAQLTFWGGGCDTASILNKATPEEVRKHVLERCELFSKDGGFISNTTHNILPEIPAENIVACFNAVKEFNKR